ncbi:MAG: hypothetical protein HY000_19995, partial [Planctomycetes bacterium]|nr:hypothetical protein [Planctomycetota bacterium]
MIRLGAAAVVITLAFGWSVGGENLRADDSTNNLRQQAVAAMKKAAAFYRG